MIAIIAAAVAVLTDLVLVMLRIAEATVDAGVRCCPRNKATGSLSPGSFAMCLS